jgi:carbamoyl-phosphate synthase small subunit
LVFQTGMVGYQEALTDPSYAGQVLIFTYPLVGNYGAGMPMSQSARIHTRGVIVRDLMESGGHRDAAWELDEMLRSQGVPALVGADTRYLVRKVRAHGVLPCALWAGRGEEPDLAEMQRLAAATDYSALDFVAECTTPEIEWHPPARPEGPKVALLDYGAKSAILSSLLEKGAGVWLVPASASADSVLSLRPDGILLSNGPGDPSRLGYVIETVQGLMEGADVPIFGICLGHQLLALAAGGRTSKMRFGHRGINQPVLHVSTGRVSITTQNHGYVVEVESVPADYIVTHTNLNDGTVEGIAHAHKPIWGIQWHPEAHPGPDDTHGLFNDFLSAMENARA